MKPLLAELHSDERRVIDWLLPEDKLFYRVVRSVIDILPISRHEDGSIEFGKYDDDLSHTIAIGETTFPQSSISLRGDEAGGGAMLYLPKFGSELKLGWTLSAWVPGKGSAREIKMTGATGKLHFVFALSPERRVLWLHHVDTGENQLIPVTGVLVELARLKRVPSTGRLTHDAFFDLADRSSDDILMEALLEYNKRARAFDASKVSLEGGERKDRGFFNIFRN